MAKQLLPHDVTAAERRDCVWASRFRRRSDEIDKGATITGTPAVNWGVTLNGTTDVIVYPLNRQIGIDPLSYQIVFYPTFAANDGASHIFFDADNGAGGTRTILEKAVDNRLFFYFGNLTTVLTVSAADLLANWIQNGRNVLTASATSGATNIWLNGTFTQASAVAWTAQNPTRLTVGGRYTIERFFAGRIESFKFYSMLMTVNGHLRVWEGGGA